MKPRVLAIDDEAHWLQSFKRWIPASVAELDCAGTSEEAIDLLRRYHYEVVLLDLSMDPTNPGDRSNRLIQLYLATRPEGTRYIITSGTVNVGEAVEGVVEANASYVIQKQTIEPEVLLHRLERALAEAEQHQRALAASTRQQWLGDQINEHNIISHLKVGAEVLGQVVSRLATDLGPVVPHPTYSALVVRNAGVAGIFWSRRLGRAVGLVLRRPDTDEADALKMLREFGERSWVRHGEERTLKNRVVVDVFTTDTGPEEFAPSFQFPFALPAAESSRATDRGAPPAQEAPAAQAFDVFLAYNSQDEELAEQLAERLKGSGIAVWMDKEQIPPGRWFQDLIQTAIPNVRAAAILLGSGGLGPWQAMELRTFIARCIEDEIPVIPVLLPGVDELPRPLLFLRELNFVRFREGIDDARALASLEWGITGVRPATTQKLV